MGTTSVTLASLPAVRAPEFLEGLDWLHVERPLRVADLRGKVVVLDFWTYGWINCLHLLPRVRELEKRFHDVLVVVGVHAGKFTAERRTPNLADACLRLGVHHPVVNDRHFRTWRAYAVRAWPTLTFLDPQGRMVAQQAGEIPLQALVDFTGRLVDSHLKDGSLVRGPFAFAREPAEAPTGLQPTRKRSVT